MNYIHFLDYGSASRYNGDSCEKNMFTKFHKQNMKLLQLVGDFRVVERSEEGGSFHVPVPLTSDFLYGFRVHPEGEGEGEGGGQVPVSWICNCNEAVNLFS
jgi:hypothetical protein